jgi:YidC/Oxa1 family membrane protein insertase
VAILNPLNDLVAWVIMRLHSAFGALFGADSGWAWGLSIVVLVMIIRLCLVPLFVKQVHAQRKMAQHAPQLQELRKKYKNDKQRLNEETMKYYKENGVNPLAGCLPMIPQLIIFFSLFSVLRFIADWKPGHALQYGFTEPVVESAQKTTIFGVHLYDKLLFRTAGSPPLSTHVVIVIVLTVVLSATTTFMTVRQTAKRGLMQTNVDPSNPMAQSQKFMQYIVPFFSLTGLYWQYGLVLYWVTTNLWTLGQQYFMFRNWDTQTSGAEGALAGATTGTAAKTAQSSARPNASRSGSGSGSAGSGSSGQSSARPASGAAKTAGTGARNGSGQASARTRTATSGRTAAQGSASARAKDGTASGSARTGSAQTGSSRNSSARTGTASRPAPAASSSATGQNGTEKRGLLRLGRAKQEPEPQDDVPAAKVVRQQPVRQARSKRSGKR